jgi:hypothetical protein
VGGGGFGKSSGDVAFGIMGVVDLVDEYDRVDPDRETVGKAIGSGFEG